MPTVTLAANALTTLERVKEQGSGIRQVDATQDMQLTFLINEASAAIMNFPSCGREFKTSMVQTTATDGAMSALSATLTSASANFTGNDVGKAIVVQGAGSGGQPLCTTILTRVGATTITLAIASSTAVNGATYTYSGATRTFRLDRNYQTMGGYIDFGLYDAQSIASVTVETQPTGGSVVLNQAILQYQPVPIEQYYGVYTGVTIYAPTGAWGAAYNAGIEHTAQVAAVWGWPSVPADVEGACIETVKEWFLAGYADTSSRGIPGETASQAQGPRHDLPWSVQRTLARYQELMIA